MATKRTIYLRKKMVDEMRYALKKMSEEKDERKKLYYFSGTYAVIQRVYNFEYDPQLVFIHHVLEDTYRIISNRVIVIAQGDKTVLLADGVIDKLHLYTSSIVDKIERDEDGIYDLLQKIVILGYTTSGNGYYLYDKGIVKI